MSNPATEMFEDFFDTHYPRPEVPVETTIGPATVTMRWSPSPTVTGEGVWEATLRWSGDTTIARSTYSGLSVTLHRNTQMTEWKTSHVTGGTLKEHRPTSNAARRSVIDIAHAIIPEILASNPEMEKQAKLAYLDHNRRYRAREIETELRQIARLTFEIAATLEG